MMALELASCFNIQLFFIMFLSYVIMRLTHMAMKDCLYELQCIAVYCSVVQQLLVLGPHRVVWRENTHMAMKDCLYECEKEKAKILCSMTAALKLASCFNVSCIFYNVFIGHDSV